MATNKQRAEWGGAAAREYTRQTRHDEWARHVGKAELAVVLGDLIGDLGHYAENRGIARDAWIDCVARGLGMWSAERRAVIIDGEQEPFDNDDVSIDIVEKPIRSAEQLARDLGWYEYDSEWRRDLDDGNGYHYAATAEHALAGNYQTEDCV